MKRFAKVFIIVFLLCIYIYACNILFMPDNIVLFEGEDLNLKAVSGITIQREDQKTKEASNNLNTKKVNEIGKNEATVSLFGKIPVKDITVNVIPKTTVVPLRNINWYETVYKRCTSSRNVRN